MEPAEIVISSISQCARGLLGPCGAMKLCEVHRNSETGNLHSVIDGYELMLSLRVSHPVAMLLRDAVNAQEADFGFGSTTLLSFVGVLLDR